MDDSAGSCLKKLYDYDISGQMLVAGFMSGSGTNLVKIIEHELKLEKDRETSPFHVKMIFSDNPKSRAEEIGRRFHIPVYVRDLVSFCEEKGKPVRDMSTREEYEKSCMEMLSGFKCSVAAYAGYMRKATSVFVNSFLGVNVHPADLSIKGDGGVPKYRGDHVVRDAIKAGEDNIRSTTHIVAEQVDCGNILMVSAPLEIKHPVYDALLDDVAGRYQDLLKEVGDWVIFPKTLEYIADGKFAKDAEGRLYFDGKAIPEGLRL